jgi:two-component system nitrate/nitrite sensor histidine kinase NarX
MSGRLGSHGVSAEGDLGARRDPPDPMGTGLTGTSRGDARRALALLRESGLSGPMVAVATTLVIALGMLVAHWLRPDLGWPHWVCLGFLVLGILSGVVAWTRLRDRLLLPLVRLERSVARISQGEPGASEALRSAGVLDRIARDIGDLNAELTDLSEDMDARVGRQTMRLAQKTASLKILYDVAAGIHQADGVDALLLRFLRVLKEMVNGRAATVRLVLADGTRRLVGSIGLDDDLVREQDMAPVDLCLCGSVLSPGDILCDQQARYCSRIYGRRMFDAEQLEVITVPLEHRDELLGVYTIFVDRPGVSAREDILDLLATVGHHLGVAIAKQRSDAEARRLSIIEERNSLAHELHDSLAQTLASLRFQVRMLHDALAQVAIPDNARLDLGRVMNGLDEAHIELRELLASFRAPLDQGGLVAAAEKLTADFARATGIHVLFQNDCRALRLSASQELQVVRIVQESLANIRKHAAAQTVRVLFTREPGGRYLVLIEDDGVGFRIPETEERAGEHIGLSIMEERARRIGAELRIDSEPGEGTRVELAIPPSPVQTGRLEAA